VLGGIYNTDPEVQSIMVSSPVMREMEKESGSLFLAALQRTFRPRPNGHNGVKPPRFITYKGGIQGIINGLVSRLAGELRLNTRVRSIKQDQYGYQIWTAQGEMIHASAIVLATLANVAAGLVKEISPEASQKLSAIRHNHIGTVSLVYHDFDLPDRLHITGLMIPRREKRAIDAVTFTSKKMPQRFAAGYTVLRIFIGGGKPEVVEFDEDTLLAVVRRELAELLGISAAPQTYKVFRWPNGFPQAEVGHLDLVNEIEKCLPADIALAGSSYRGIAIPDCIRQGRNAVGQILKHTPTLAGGAREGHDGHQGESKESRAVAPTN
jgi:oxygen-dependent protoporphyrinogen oxidase